MLNLNQRKSFVCVLMAALLLSVAAASAAQARTEVTPSPPEAADAGQTAPDTPNLIMTLDGNTTAPENQDSEPNLYQAQDTTLASDDNSTRTPTEGDAADLADENSLIATNTETGPDYSIPLVALAAFIAAIVAAGVLLTVRKNKKD